MSLFPENSEAEKAMLVNQNQEIAAALLEASNDGGSINPLFKSAIDHEDTHLEDEAERTIRKDMIEPTAADPNGFERIMGRSDLTSINYLERGRRAAASVCRIRVPSKGGDWHGTGFLVGPQLLLTNNHVLHSREEASQAEVEFEYEHDLDGVLKPPVGYNLAPYDIFFTDIERDFTLCSISALSNGGVPIRRYGWLPLIPMSGKSVDKEWVTIIQHPQGGPKQISIRSSQIKMLPPELLARTNTEQFIHYLTDTEPGSSGAPVLNDQWQVIALHHKAIAAPQDIANPNAKIKWIGNEGVRISAIFAHLERHRFADADAGKAINVLESGIGYASNSILGEGQSANYESDAKPFTQTRWNKPKIGYDENFLSSPINLEKIYSKLKMDDLVAPLKDKSGFELHYHHYSAVIHKMRKFAILTAVNIDGAKLVHPGDRVGAFRIDNRMDAIYQPAGKFYEKAAGDDKIQFSRGHLVRRLDPCWGEGKTPEERKAQAKLGEEDTFHYSNAAPQFQKYNAEDWGNIEDYVLNHAQMSERKMTVLQGPIFRANDPLYGKNREGGPWQIPLSYWKIAIIQKSPGVIAAAGFVNGQTQYVKALYEAKIFTNLNPYTTEELKEKNIQTTIASIEEMTELDFGDLKLADARGSLESTRQTSWLRALDDIII